MKLAIPLLALFAACTLNVQSQPTFKNGSFTTVKNETVNDGLRILKGKLVTESSPGKSYRPGDLKSFRIDSTNYISYENDFYNEVTTGKLVTLYQKITDNHSEKIYNGADPVGFLKTTDGNIGDYYILVSTTGNFDLVNKKNFKNYFLKMLTTHDNLASQIESGSLGFAQIKQVTDMYNNQ